MGLMCEGKAAIYLRVATTDQVAIDMQKEKVLRFAAAQGIVNPVCYADNGYNGLNLDRPGLSRLQADIFAGKIQTVIALDEMRIGRELLLVGEWMEGAKKMGVRILYLNSRDYSREDEIRKQLAEAIDRALSRRRKSFAKE